MTTLFPPLLATVFPAALLLAGAYPLRPQGGRMRHHPRPASQVLASCDHDRTLGIIPADAWGGVDRPSEWTVRPVHEADALMRELGDTQQMAAVS
ncbi:hypothetical protein [Rhizomonospora bruguierae]|uniref:hypothetical protein n=1 Tax=Rhizomonospora bruguierae TaxID=1581705 RepID=UPI001BCDB304|nr:hypothetical protein [Micromonospora sp. NBRC 107566]